MNGNSLNYAVAEIVCLVSRITELKRVGPFYTGLCPFHPEDKPSFILKPDDGTFHCFRCGKSGKAENLATMVEATKRET